MSIIEEMAESHRDGDTMVEVCENVDMALLEQEDPAFAEVVKTFSKCADIIYNKLHPDD